jgi:hypothetical protein
MGDITIFHSGNMLEPNLRHIGNKGLEVNLKIEPICEWTKMQDEFGLNSVCGKEAYFLPAGKIAPFFHEAKSIELIPDSEMYRKEGRIQKLFLQYIEGYEEDVTTRATMVGCFEEYLSYIKTSWHI